MALREAAVRGKGEAAPPALLAELREAALREAALREAALREAAEEARKAAAAAREEAIQENKRFAAAASAAAQLNAGMECKGAVDFAGCEEVFYRALEPEGFKALLGPSWEGLAVSLKKEGGGRGGRPLLHELAEEKPRALRHAMELGFSPAERDEGRSLLPSLVFRIEGIYTEFVLVKGLGGAEFLKRRVGAIPKARNVEVMELLAPLITGSREENLARLGVTEDEHAEALAALESLEEKSEAATEDGFTLKRVVKLFAHFERPRLASRPGPR